MTQRTILLSPKPLLTPRFQADHFNWDLADNCCQPGCEVGDGTGMCNLRWLGKSGQNKHQRGGRREAVREVTPQEDLEGEVWWDIPWEWLEELGWEA